MFTYHTHRSPFPKTFNSPASLSALLALVTCLLTLPALSAPVSLRAYPVITRITAPSGHAISSFDFAPANSVVFMTGDPFYDLGLTLWRHDGSSAVSLFTDPGVFAGSRVVFHNGRIYFNDGGDYSRWTYDYFLLNPDNTVTQVLDSTVSISLWGGETGPDNALYASGAEGFGPSRIYRIIPDPSGLFSDITMLEEIGDASGPLAFTPAGGLYCVPGYYYAGPPVPVYGYTAQEVAAALADPTGAPLTPSGHVWAELPAPYTGASGAVTDSYGRLYVSANAWGEPGRILMYTPQDPMPVAVAENPGGRIETLRIDNGKLVFNTADGIYETPIPLIVTTTGGTVEATAGDPLTLSVQTDGGAGTFHYQWFRVTGEKTSVPVGDNLPYYTFTPGPGDDGTRYYCEVSDAGFTVVSPEFVLRVSLPTPVGKNAFLVLLILLPTAAIWFRKIRLVRH